MANWHGYIGIENLNLDAPKRATLFAALQALGPVSDRQPARLCHWRRRLDDDAAIFEALFNENALAVAVWKNRLGAIFGVSPSAIDHATTTAHFAGGDTPVVTFSRSGVDYLHVALFSGVGATWEESRTEVLGYLAANRAEWEPEEV